MKTHSPNVNVVFLWFYKQITVPHTPPFKSSRVSHEFWFKDFIRW